MPFTTGLLVNRIFSSAINGSTEDANVLRKSIEKSSTLDQYKDVPKNAIESGLKALASRKMTQQQIRES